MPFSAIEESECRRLIEWGLREDLGEPRRDLTSAATIPDDMVGQAAVVVRQAGVIAGLESLLYLARELDFDVQVLGPDGPVPEGTIVARMRGRLQSILAAERLALNLMGHMSGVATLTAQYVELVRGTKAKICDTRKTTPGWRYLDKYAVRVGGGTNHRIGLFDGVLIKDNHLAGLAQRQAHPIATAVGKARRGTPAGTILEVEIDSLTQLDEALGSEPDMILLDNMTPDNLSLAVEIRDAKAPQVLLEASGGINLETVRVVALSGVDRISVGALTHSAAVLDLALDYEEGT